MAPGIQFIECAFLFFNIFTILTYSLDRNCPYLNKCSCKEDRSLEKVNCENRGFREIPFTIPENASSINFAANQIKEFLYLDGHSWRHVWALYLSDNKLVSLQNNAVGAAFPNLKLLQLDGNNITAISDKTFKGLIHLESLMLGRNDINYIPVKAFGTLTELKHLTLSMNKLTKLNINTFRNNHKLAFLDLSKNRISEIIGSDWPDNLTNLDMSMNMLKIMPPLPPSARRESLKINFLGNKLICACRNDHLALVCPSMATSCSVLFECNDANMKITPKANCQTNIAFQKWIAFQKMPICRLPKVQKFVRNFLPKMDKIKLTCDATGYPAPVVSIKTLDGTELTENKEMFKAEVVLNPSEAKYVCYAESSIGKDAKLVTEQPNENAIGVSSSAMKWTSAHKGNRF